MDADRTVQLSDLKPLSSGATAMDPGAEYEPDEVQVLKAIETWKKVHRKAFITPIEVLRLLKHLGWTAPQT